MKRVIMDPLPPAGSITQPEKDECHHLLKVRRIQDGELVEILDGKGGVARAKAHILSKSKLQLEVLAHVAVTRESQLRLSMVLALPVQRNTIDGLIPGLTQIGVQEIFFVPTAFGGRIKREAAAYRARLLNIAHQALKQSGRTVAPSITLLSNWSEACTQVPPQYELNLLFHPQTGDRRNLLPSELASLCLWLGPEGGFNTAEVEAARNNGILVDHLGPRILKMETAVLGSCFWAQRHWGDF